MLKSRPLPIAVLLLLAAPAAQAQKPPTDPQAVALLTQMVHTYQGLKSYSATETAMGPQNLGMPYRLALTYARPDRVALKVVRPEEGTPAVIRIVSDGTTYSASNSQYPKRYLQTAPPKAGTALDEAMKGGDIKFALIPDLIEHGGALIARLTDGTGGILRLGHPAVLDGVAVDTLLMESSGPGYHGTSAFQIGHADHLLRRSSSTDENKGQPIMTIVQTFTQVRANPRLTATAFAFVPPPAALAAAHTDPPKPDAQAVALVAGMYAAYDALHSFSCAMHFTGSFPAHDARGNHKSIVETSASATYLLQKPNKVAFTRTSRLGMAQAVCDGRFLYAQTTEARDVPEGFYDHPRYLKKPAPDSVLDLARFGDLPLYGTYKIRDWMPEVAVGVDFMPAGGGYGFQLGGPATLNGEPTDMVVLERTSNYLGGIPDESRGTLTLWISQNDHLLRQVREEQRREDGTTVMTETYTDVKADPDLPPSTFAFTPPANGIAVGTVAALLPPPVARPVIGPLLHVGGVPPAAVFRASDTDGKPVTLADYRGKVVLLDFWATWCAPCLDQIPSTVSAYQKYHGQGLEIVGYALEQPKDRSKLPLFVRSRNMAWREVWDKDAALANACGPTNGIPFAIVVGRDGKIAALGTPGDDLDVTASVKAALARP